MLVALLGGRALPASELARLAHVSPSTTTSHLRHLREAGLVTMRPLGRHRYFALAGTDVADALERFASLGLAGVACKTPPPREAIAIARTCYAHLAGALAVAFWRRAEQSGWVAWSDEVVRLLPKGTAVLRSRGVFVNAPPDLAGTSCLDWSERVPHVAGRLGVTLCNELLAFGWVRRVAEGRALRVTARGDEELGHLGVRWK